MNPLNFRPVALVAVLALRGTAAESPRIATSSVAGRFFANPSGSGAFSATSSSPVIFTQRFAAINFNPPAGAILCKNLIDVDENSRPFTNVVARRDGSCSAVVAQGNGQRAGVANLQDFNAVFTGTFTLSARGRVTFNIYGDDGWILGIARQGGVQPSFVSGPRENAPAQTPFSRLPVVGAYNTSTAPTRNDLVVDFPASGVYDFELDYSECCSGELALTLTADGVALATTGSLWDPVILVIVLAIGTMILTRRRNRNEQRRRRELRERGFALRVAGDVRGASQAGYHVEIRSANDWKSGRLEWDE
jgi:hypothetical protein